MDLQQGNARSTKWIARLWPAVLLVLLTAALEYVFFGLGKADLSIPFLYGGDGTSGLVGIKNLLHGDSARLGWPLHIDTSAYSPRYDLVVRAFERVCALFTDSAVLIYDLRILFIPIACVLVCYFVLQSLGVRRWLAGAGALTYGLCPYVQMRLAGHQSLAAAEFVPVALLLCLWCWEDERFGRPGKGYFHYRRNWLALLFTWCIANNGMVYYPYFACFFLCLTALCMLLHRRDVRVLEAPLLTVAQITGWLALDFLPTVAGMLQGSGNAATKGVFRTITGADIYGLRISSLLLSPHGYGVPLLGQWIRRYFTLLGAEEGVTFNENANAYLGIVGVIGFLLLLVLLFASFAPAPEQKPLARRLWLLSRLTAGALLLSVLSGFGAMIGIFVRFLRCYNRIAPYLVCLAVTAVILCLETCLQRLPKSGKRRWAAVCLAVLLLGYGLWEQLGFFRIDQEAIRAQWASDAAFGAQMEQAAGENGLVFQLPYMQSFENGPVNKMPDYALRRGLLHTDTLRFSYGAGIGSENDVWYKTTSELPASELVAELRAKGFAGIYLDRDGYTEDSTEKALCAAAGCAEPLVSPGGTLVYIPL